ncbi:hypothetical protein FQN53_003992 [Emmonsiellopsis sp. PD_33]|nr:hypothetical protein FQN53_003992 [Emmonsiellopsis sp. PD_33]
MAIPFESRHMRVLKSDLVNEKAAMQQIKERRDRVVAVYSKIYGIAKFIFAILLAYGVELDSSPTGIKFHISRVESQMDQESTTELLSTVEDLYYALYARLNIEIANVQLCESFQLDIRKMALRKSSLTAAAAAAAAVATGEDTHHLPAPALINMIFQACKRILRSEDICGFLDREIIHQHQAAYVQRAVEAYAAARPQRPGEVEVEVDDVDVDLLGYRRHIERLVADPNSEFRAQWSGLNPIYKYAPGMVLATLSEKYLALQPKRSSSSSSSSHSHSHSRSSSSGGSGSEVSDTSDYSDNNGNDRHTRTRPRNAAKKSIAAHLADTERRRISANREAAYAMLNGMTVGEHRRLDGKRSLRAYVRDELCICFGYCSCAKECTVKDGNARRCPCSGRMGVICDVDDGGDGEGVDGKRGFAERCARLAGALFGGLCEVRGDTSFFEVYMEVKGGLEVFHQEVVGYRNMVGLL